MENVFANIDQLVALKVEAKIKELREKYLLEELPNIKANIEKNCSSIGELVLALALINGDKVKDALLQEKCSFFFPPTQKEIPSNILGGSILGPTETEVYRLTQSESKTFRQLKDHFVAVNKTTLATVLSRLVAAKRLTAIFNHSKKLEYRLA